MRDSTGKLMWGLVPLVFVACSGEMSDSSVRRGGGGAGDQNTGAGPPAAGRGGADAGASGAGATAGAAGQTSLPAGGAAASAGTTGSTPAATVGKGYFDCPAVEAPAYTIVPAGGELSMRFQSTCAGCHGPAGEGRPGYPTIPGQLTVEQYRTTVRQGKGTNMPAFDATAITDDQIAADFAILSKGSTTTGGADANGRTRPESWSPAKRDQVLARGLEVLRTPDKYGTACANCHSPDALELAFIGYTDADVLRRALQHVSSDEALDLVDYVHAMRLKYDIKQPCSPQWRPFQPGGEPLAGTTVQEREVAFAAELDKRKVLLYTKPIQSLADAKAAADDVEALDLRRLPIGVKFPRWSEDGFHGDEHKSFFDWMPGAGRIPNDPKAWYAMHDAYLADPTLEKLRAFDRKIETDTKLGRTDSHGRFFPPIAKAQYDAHLWVEEILLDKHRTVLLGAHLFRMALLKQSGWYEQAGMPFTELRDVYNPFFQLGMTNTESPCYNSSSCETQVAAAYPQFMKDELKPSDTPGIVSQQILSDPWCYVGQLLDHSLMKSENDSGPTQTGFYWNIFTFEHRLVQQPLFTAHRMVTQAAYVTRYRGTDKLPQGIPVLMPRGMVHPFLDGEWAEAFGIESPRTDAADARLGPSTFLRANLALMIAHIGKDRLSAGASVANKQKGLEHIAKLRAPAQQMAELLKDPAWAAKNPRNRDNAAVLVTGALKLIGEFESLYRAAPEVP